MVYSEKQQSNSKRVCVIGAGPSGLVSARELRRERHSVVLMEQNHDIGGQWLYNPNVEQENPLSRATPVKVFTSVYSSLRLISPRELSGYSDFPFVTKEGRDARRFPGHREFYLYLKDFCEFYGLEEIIRFDTRVEYVGMTRDLNLKSLESGSEIKWMVRSKEKSGKQREEIFDAVVVANGHYSQPNIPYIRGMDNWRRKQLHSHVYRVPDSLGDEIVVIVGSSTSGIDISLELVSIAKEIHLSSKTTEINEGLSKLISKYENLHLHPQIDILYEDGRVLFLDGSCVVADTIIYCTGYVYSFPFLDTKGVVTVNDNRVGPLYEHTFPPLLAPSLSFVGIPNKIFPFLFFERQAKWIAQVLSGERTLPSTDEMMKSVEEFYHEREIAGIPRHYTHDIADFGYFDRYGDNCGCPHLEEWKKELFNFSLRNYITDLETFRDKCEDDDHELIQIALQSLSITHKNQEHNCSN